MDNLKAAAFSRLTAEVRRPMGEKTQRGNGDTAPECESRPRDAEICPVARTMFFLSLLLLVPTSQAADKTAEVLTSENLRECFERGIEFQKTGQYEKAVTAYLKAISISPNVAIAHNNLGSVYLRLTKYALAIKSFERANELDPSLSEALFNIGICYYRQDNHKVALQCFRRFLERNPRDARANYLAGTCSFLLDDFSGASAHLERAKQNGTADLPLLYQLAAIYIRTNQRSRGDSLIQEMFIKYGETPEWSLLLGQMHYRYEELDKALQETHRCLEQNPRMAMAHHLRGMIYWKKSQFDLAEHEFLEEIELSPRHAESYFMLGQVRARKGQYKEALPSLQRTIELVPLNAPGAYYLLGKCHLKLNETEKGIDCLRRAISQDPRHRQSHYLLGMELRRLGRAEEAERHFALVNQMGQEKLAEAEVLLSGSNSEKEDGEE